MTILFRISVLLVLMMPVLNCSSDSGTIKDLSTEAGRDGTAGDLGQDHTPQDHTVDAFAPLPGVGVLSGDCGFLDDTEWQSTGAYLFSNTIDLGAAAFDPTKLSKGGQQIWAEGNRGGSSIHSEIFAFEVLRRCELATLLKTEGKILYTNSGGKKTDLLVRIDGRTIGVSVTRAFHYPPPAPFSEAEAKSLLDKKLADLPLSKQNAAPQDAWSRSILHVLAYDSQHASVVQSVWNKKINASAKGDAILILTVTDGKDDYIY